MIDELLEGNFQQLGESPLHVARRIAGFFMGEGGLRWVGFENVSSGGWRYCCAADVSALLSATVILGPTATGIPVASIRACSTACQLTG